MNDANSVADRVALPTCTAFLGASRVAHGAYADVGLVLAAMLPSDEPMLVFDDASGALVDYPWAAGIGNGSGAATEAATGSGGVGRPRLGVVAREVTLLPRHWDWLAQQRGGASAALRRLVDEARHTQAQADCQRLARERAYRFMSTMAANWPDFEEASRALFAGDGPAFDRRTQSWPADVKGHLAWLARDAFDATA